MGKTMTEIQDALLDMGAEKIEELRRERNALARLLEEIERHPDTTEDIAYIIKANLPRRVRGTKP
jgi:hypothetical protein